MNEMTNQDCVSIRLSSQAQAESRMLNDYVWAYNRIFGNDQTSAGSSARITTPKSRNIIVGRLRDSTISCAEIAPEDDLMRGDD